MPDLNDTLLAVNIKLMIDYHSRKESECRSFGETQEARRHRDAISTLSNTLARIKERANDTNKR